ncbi:MULTISPECIES: hypothetical protein [Providencia]|jgi:phosphoglycerol transferase MdoB-like AlkP superfamily enzyme|uniref:hypothetical protein n=1 Tax=Providencia TaxID=586 RepID=UPI001C5B30A2|nr:MULTISPECIES: hypothetical protein [Providencia]ELR5151392.1 hypothetical protein [Providencia rettgeri]MDR2227274.1 hypothetical protein [Providencia sp.]QXX82695.1 hypothetical protein J6836_21240 [Providencia sp. R33]
MISIPFSWLGFTDWLLDQEAGIIIMFATFGTLFASIVSLIILNVLGLKKLSGYVAGSLFCSVFISMIVMIPLMLLFGFEETIKFQLIWLVIVGSCLLFFLTNQNYLDSYFNKAVDKANNEIKNKQKKSKGK